MASKYIIYKFYLQRFNAGREEKATAEQCAKMIEAFMPDDCKENGLKIVGKKKKGGKQELSELSLHGNLLEQHFRNMACLLVEANKTKTITINYNDHEEEHNPYLHVLFDFNPEHCLIAIERKESAMKVEKAVELLKLTFNTLLLDSGWQFMCEQPNIPMNFWELIHFVKDRFKDKLKKVSLVFDNDKSQNRKKDKSEENKKLKFVDELISRFGKGGLYIDFAGDKELETYRDDILYFASLCAENKYQLIAEFTKFGALYHTDYFPAIMPLGNDVLDEFTGRRSETNLKGYKIEEWFDNIHKLFYEQEEMNENERRRREMDKV